MYKLYLASKSPRRRQLLSLLRADFEIVDANIPEQPRSGETALDYVQRIALEKAVACRQSVPGTEPILAADTEVVLDDRILGKPSDMDAAIHMLQSLAGREHQVLTAVVLLREKPAIAVSVSRVWFRALTHDECIRYCKKYNPLDKAGAYGIQDLAAGFIWRFEGSYSGVMGLPRVETAQLLSGIE
jgi:septum formation protein